MGSGNASIKNCKFNDIWAYIDAFGTGVYAPPTWGTLEVVNSNFSDILSGSAGLAIYFH